MPVTRPLEDLGLAPVARFPDLGNAQEHVLVVLAMNLDCLITIDEDGNYLLHADPLFTIAIHEEFGRYAAEQAELTDPPHLPIFGSGMELALLWVCALFFFFIMQDKNPSYTARYLNSSIDVVQEQQFYRPFTALFLHADVEHLMGNITFGLIFGIFVAHSLGPWTAWCLILTAGFIGNTINAVWHYPEPFLSLGASTATFGALGLLVGTGLHIAWLSRHSRESFRVFVPLAAGLMLLSLWGAGGPEVDVAGHIWGFTAGVFLGIPASFLRTNLLEKKKLLQ